MTTTRETIDRAIGEIVRNASNFPEKVQARILGQDMGPLRRRLTDAVLVALSTPPAEDVRAAVEAERQRAAAHSREGYRANENCDDITKRILSGEPAEVEIPGHAWPPPADDVREALAALKLAVEQDAPDDAYPTLVTVDRKSLADVLAAFEVRPHGTVTDAEVDAAARSLAGLSEALWAELVQEGRPELAYYVDQARAALQAARKAES